MLNHGGIFIKMTNFKYKTVAIYNNETFYDDGKKLVAYKYADTDFVKANKDCSNCDHHNNYCCFDCEQHQVRLEYKKVRYTDNCEWVVPK